MKVLVAMTLLSVAAAKPAPGGIISPWDQPWASPPLSSVSLVHQPAVLHAAPAVVHAAPAVAFAKPAATSYASFQQIVDPVVAQPVVHAPVVAQPYVHAVAQPLVQAVHAAPVVAHAVAQPVYQKVLPVGAVGHGW